MSRSTIVVIILYSGFLIAGQAFSASNNSSGSSPSSSSSSKSQNHNVTFEVSGGTSELNQTMAADNIEHPLAYRFSGRWHKSIFQAGVSYLALLHRDDVNVNPAGTTPNPNEVDVSENFTLTALTAGLWLGDWLLLDAGYGYATFSRNQSMPYATSTTSSSYSATGTGWLAGGSLVPIHFGNDHVAIGVTGYYFSATATDYSSDVWASGTETYKPNGNGTVKTSGWYAGVSLFFGI